MAYTPTLGDIQDYVPQQAPPTMNMGNANNNSGYTPNFDDVQDLMQSSAAPNPPVNPGDSRGFLNNTLRHTGAVLGSYGRDLINTPNKIYSKIPAFNEGYDYYKALDVERGLPDEVAEGVLNFAPYITGVGGVAKLAANGAGKAAGFAPKFAEMFQKGVKSNLFKVPTASAVQGAVNAEPGNRGEGALEGLGWGLVGWGSGKAGDAILRKGLERYAQSAIPTLVSKATDKIKGYITPEQGAKVLQGNYNKAAAVNKSNWALTDSEAKALDKSLTINKTVEKPSAILDAQGNPIFKSSTKKVVDFDNSPFKTSINKYLSSVRKLEPAERAQHQNAAGFARYIKKIAPQSFTGAVSLRQNLNQELKKYLEKNNIKLNDYQTKKLITTLKKDLGGVVDKNADKVDPQLFRSFKDSWEGANKSHRELQDFYKRPNAENVLKPTRQRREALQGGEVDRAALGSYVKPSLGGNKGLEQLNKLTGSDDAARSYIMRDVIEGRGSPTKALTSYEKLAVPQRERLFAGRPEGEALNAASYARNKVGNLPEKKHWGGSFGHHAGMFGVPGGVTFLGALAAGKDWEDAAKLGTGVGLAATAGGAVPRALGKLATPKSVIGAVNRSQTAGRNTGKFMSPALQALFPSFTEKRK